MRRSLAGVLAGLAGSGAVALLDALETRARGHTLVYDPRLMAGRLARRRLGLELGDGERRWVARLMRWPYGAGWGALLGLAPPGALPGWPVAGVALGAAVLGFELTALPLVGATPPPEAWSGGELAADALNTLVYGLVTAAALHALTGGDAGAGHG